MQLLGVNDDDEKVVCADDGVNDSDVLRDGNVNGGSLALGCANLRSILIGLRLASRRRLVNGCVIVGIVHCWSGVVAEESDVIATGCRRKQLGDAGIGKVEFGQRGSMS